jgi:hypothetical protein
MKFYTRKLHFRLVSFMLISSTYLPVIFVNLPPFIRSHHIWTIIWGISLITFYPKIFLNKAMVYLISYALFLYVGTKTIWINMDDKNHHRLFLELYQVSIGISVITYFFQSKDYFGLAQLTKWSIVFLFITAIMTIISSSLDPMYARNIVSISSITLESKKEIIMSFKQFGGGNYSTAGAFMCLFPILIYYYKNIELRPLLKNLIIIFAATIFYALLGMQIFGNILIATVFGIIALLGMKKIRKSIIVILVFLFIIMLIPKYVYVDSLKSVGNEFSKNSELNYKFNDLATFIETGANLEDKSTGIGGRAERYPILLQAFIKSPLFGYYYSSNNYDNFYNPEGAHLYWMNKLTITGIVGLVFFSFILYYFLKVTIKRFDFTYRFFYLLASLSILFYGFMKVIGGRETWYAFFIILPGLYFLPLLKNNKINRLKKTKLV